MTDKQLEKLHIHRDGGKLKPNNYWCNTTQSNMKIYRQNTYEDVMQMIYDEAYNQGVEEGKSRRSRELKALIFGDD